jgi:hypothetical protein
VTARVLANTLMRLSGGVDAVDRTTIVDKQELQAPALSQVITISPLVAIEAQYQTVKLPRVSANGCLDSIIED